MQPSLPRLIATVFVCVTTVATAQGDGAPPFAVAVEFVSFPSGAVRLVGGFLKPEGRGPFPAVVLAHGAGPATFDEPAFRVHANAFIRAGFAVLVYDKRGSGRSTGSLSMADYDDLVTDIAAGVQLLRARGRCAGQDRHTGPKRGRLDGDAGCQSRFGYRVRDLEFGIGRPA